MKKVTLLNTNIAWGGGEKWHFETALYLKDIGYACELICYPESALAIKARKHNIIVHKLKVGKLSFLNPFLKKKFKELTKTSDVIIVNLPQDFKFASAAAAKTKSPKIFYRRGMPHPIKNSFINRLLFPRLGHIIANSQEVAKGLYAQTEHWFPKEKIVIIYNGIDQENLKISKNKLYQKRDNEIVLGNAARLVEQKGQIDLLKIANILKQRDFKFHLLIAGTGPLESELRQYCARHDLEQYITFIGHVDDMPAFFNSIDYFIFPSSFEGLPNTLLEAMAYGKPCFAYDISSMPEVLNYTNGHLSPYRNFKDMAQKIEQHDRNDERLTNNAKETIREKFDYRKNMQKLVKLLED